MGKVNYKEKGITLIALVITIIILLILAGVTLTTALGQNGLFERAKYAGEKYKESEADETEKLGEVEKEIDKIVDGESNTPVDTPLQKEATLNVKLSVKEAEVTGSVIPVSVEKITSIENDSQTVEGNFKYMWYITDGTETLDEDSHRFENLDEEKTYTLNCKVVNENGEWGVGEVTVISFQIQDKYYRATKGMTWEDLCYSSYDKTPPDLSNFGEHNHEGEPIWSNLTLGWDNQNVGFLCNKCPYYEYYGEEYNEQWGAWLSGFGSEHWEEIGVTRFGFDLFSGVGLSFSLIESS